MQEIARRLHCSVHKVQYWMLKHRLDSRSISDALYLRHNPKGDPFRFVKPKKPADHFLFGLGLGLYWGEGTKASPHSVRLGNTDPELMRKFIEFLEKIYGVKRKDRRSSLQLFSDMSGQQALGFWRKTLKIHRNQFCKVIVTKSGSIGTYRKKSLYGVLTVYYNNTKLRNLLVSLLPP